MAASHLNDEQVAVLRGYYMAKTFVVEQTDSIKTTEIDFIGEWDDYQIIDEILRDRGWKITIAQARFYRQRNFGKLYLRGPNKVKQVEETQEDPSLPEPAPEPPPPPEAFAGEPPPPPPSGELVRLQEWAAITQEVMEEQGEELKALREELRVVKERQDVQVVEIFDVTEYLTRQNANWRRKE